MSARTQPALDKLDLFLPHVKALPKTPENESLLQDAEALRRAVEAFHMEAIRFRMYNVDRRIKALGDPPVMRKPFDDARHALEEAGFYTRSHSAPGQG